MLKIYNTLSRQKEIFKPLHPGKVGFYVCGVTPYDFCHIGHARVYLAFDAIMRYLRYQGFQVKYIRNITDIEDKIIQRAQEKNEPFEHFSERYIQAMHDDFNRLNLTQPTLEPRATEYIQQMIDLIQQLIHKGYAYVANNGDVYYSIEKFKTYGCLSHRHLDALEAGARVEKNIAKQNPLDFVLWKMAKPNEPHWTSPWGAGRPGWHIECSAMALHNLGTTLDIHGGGPDLKFPHHENERAQSEAITDQPLANYWMHVGFVQQDQEKMSKSLNNFVTIRDFLEHYDAEVLRFFAIASHYRSPIDYSTDNTDTAVRALERLYTALRGLETTGQHAPQNSQFEQRFIAAMNDDFNTPEAIAVLFELAREINRIRESRPSEALMCAAILKKLGNVLGLLSQSPDTFLQDLRGKSIAFSTIHALILERNEARQAKNWEKSDRIRAKLLQEGIILEDKAEGTVWHIAQKGGSV